MLICLVSALSLISCSTTPTMSTRASRVRLITAIQAHEVEAKCEFLGNVTGLEPLCGFCLCWGFPGCWTYNNRAVNELLDNAAELGATHVFVNRGDGNELRGDAYLCAYCRRPDGNPDEDYCETDDGNIEIPYCEDADGKIIGAAHCKGAEGRLPAECKQNNGKWITAIDQMACESQDHKWIPKSLDRETCEARGGKWRPKAKDQITCEAKGGTWIINTDVLRRAASPAKE